MLLDPVLDQPHVFAIVTATVPGALIRSTTFRAFDTNVV
jgi:hypothetical protein